MKYLKPIFDVNNGIYSPKNNHVVLCFDNNYLYPAINTMNSIHTHNNDIDFVCLCSKLSTNNLNVLLSIKEYGVRVIEIQWSKQVNTRFYSIDVAFNVYLPWILNDIKRCVYVDPDVICLQNISSIFKTEAIIRMSLEISGMVENNSSRLPGNKLTDVFYYNTGVMFMNLESIREMHSSQEIDSTFIDRLDEYYLLDQDFFNSFYKNYIKPLPISWNVQWYEFSGGYFYNKVIQEAVFIHFSFHKPWRYTSPFKQSSLYLKHSTCKEIVSMVKKARRKRFWYLIGRFFLAPIKCILRRKAAK